jgi:hypothetical protein
MENKERKIIMDDERLINIASHQEQILTLKEIKQQIEDCPKEDVKFKIETKHWLGLYHPTYSKRTDKWKIDKASAMLILDMAIKVEKQKINNLIDIEIKERMKDRGLI